MQHFLLLDTRNSHGPCLAVHIYTEEELKQEETTGSFHRTHALIQDFDDTAPETSHHKRKVFQLDEYEEDIRAPDRCYVEMDHNLDIAFSYACEDCGMLYRPHLKLVRIWYVDWMKAIWDLGT